MGRRGRSQLLSGSHPGEEKQLIDLGGPIRVVEEVLRSDGDAGSLREHAADGDEHRPPRVCSRLLTKALDVRGAYGATERSTYRLGELDVVVEMTELAVLDPPGSGNEARKWL